MTVFYRPIESEKRDQDKYRCSTKSSEARQLARRLDLRLDGMYTVSEAIREEMEQNESRMNDLSFASKVAQDRRLNMSLSIRHHTVYYVRRQMWRQKIHRGIMSKWAGE